MTGLEMNSVFVFTPIFPIFCKELALLLLSENIQLIRFLNKRKSNLLPQRSDTCGDKLLVH